MPASKIYPALMLYRRMIFLILLAALTAMSGCTGEPSGLSQVAFIQTPVGSPVKMTTPTRRVALVMKTLTNPFFIEMEKGARKAEAESGIQLIIKTAAQETSIEQQIEIVDGLVKDQVDAIVIAPGDSAGLIPALKKAQDAGIVIINIDNRLDQATADEIGLKNVPYISVNNEEGAYLSAKYISDKMSMPSQAAIIEGIQSARNSVDRKKGALRAFQENPNIEVVASETAHWKIDEAYEVTKAIFANHPDIDLLFCANDMMALGAIKYLEETGRKDVLVAGYDALEEAQESIRAGKLSVTIDQQASLQGYMGVKYAISALNGEKLSPETMVDIKLVSIETLQ